MKIISYGLYLESIQLISNYIYYLCCINTIKNLNLKSIIVSYVDLNYEYILYKACRDSDITSIFYDFSMGYPITNNFKGRLLIDINRSPNYVVTFGNLRCNQYKLANRFKESFKKTISYNSICPQIEYARFEILKNKL